MPEARAMNIALMVDDANEFNGPLWVIPGSHREGVYEAGHDLQTTSYSSLDFRQGHGHQTRR